MANDAFALSPISASSALPSESDYHAISEAFMETSRGRWFLKEYARRNRNSDTAMVLEAVERIESVLAAQKQPEQPSPETAIAETLATIRAIVESARNAAAEALAGLHNDEARAPTRKGLRIILEIAWRLREIGYDSRICDILEAQANTIGANQDALAALQTNETVLGAFDAILRQIGDLVDAPQAAPAAPSPPAVAENVVSLKPAAAPAPMARATPAPAEAAPAPVPAVDGADAAAVEAAAEAAVIPVAAADATAAAQAAAAPVAAAPAAAPPVAAPAPASQPMAEQVPNIAAETVVTPAVAPMTMAAVQTTAAPPEPVTAPAAAAPQPVASAPAPTVATAVVNGAEAAPAASPSLGDALLARGMVAATTKPQPLAAILRMSQAEKIAFFS